MPYEWAEDVVDVPDGVSHLDVGAPTDDNEYVMYYGTTRQNAEDIQKSGFQRSADGMLGPSVYLSRGLQKASSYHNKHPESDWAVIKVRVKVGRVITINRQNRPRQETWHDPAHADVYDTAWVPQGMGWKNLLDACVWDPNKIKIIRVIHPAKVQDTDTKMPYEWAEDVVDVPDGVSHLDVGAPTDDNEYVMYYGTTRQNAEDIQKSGFQRSADGMLGPSVYLSRGLQKASSYHNKHPESDWAVIKVRVKVGRVITINRQNRPRQETWHDPAHADVYDTAWVPQGMGWKNLLDACVWDPNKIKIIRVIHPAKVQ